MIRKVTKKSSAVSAFAKKNLLEKILFPQSLKNAVI